MNFAQLNPIARSRIKAPYFNATSLLAGLAVLLVFVIAIYLAAMSPGAAIGDFASMTAFPLDKQVRLECR
jgi:hypothetical protein